MEDLKMDTLVSLCKRKGFVFQSSEIYGGLNGVYDYGPLGSLLKNNIRDFWWNEMTRGDDNIVGLDSSILMHRRVWEASGHVSNFTDPLVDCKECKSRFRADQIDLKGACPVCGRKGTFTDVRKFNLMFKTNIGSTATDDDSSTIYLRPETAQGIYVNFKNVVDSTHEKLPFGIAQVGKSFRNEITTKNFIFRSCEFEQMEMQWFCKPGTDEEWFNYWRQKRIKYYVKMGIREDHLRWHQHGPDELAFYAKDAYDIQYKFPMDWQELEGVHNRTNYDLTQHAKFSGKDLQYFDQEKGERFIPYIIETSAGLTRNLLMVLSDAYDEEEVDGEKRVVLRFHPDIAPIKVAVLPLVKKDGIAEKAKEIEKGLRRSFKTDYDQNVAIGRRYRRQDEIGTPYCVTVDYDTMKDDTVTIRLRDSMKQERVKISEIESYIRSKDSEYKRI